MSSQELLDRAIENEPVDDFDEEVEIEELEEENFPIEYFEDDLYEPGEPLGPEASDFLKEWDWIHASELQEVA